MSELRRSHGFPLNVAVRSDVGRVRANNEDSFGHAWLDDGSLFVIVADGMGGHEAGEVASGLAVRVLEDAVARDSTGDPRERLYHGLLEANEAILEEGRRSGTRGMGTTAVASIFKGPEVHVGLIGDSRLYHVRRGQLVWRTLDHTRVQMLIERGEITEEAARTHPESGMLTRALGHSRMADGQPLVPDVLADPLTLEENDALVFCSDGLHDLVDDWEVAKAIAGKDPNEAAQTLVELANERGGHDNITVAVVVAGDRTESFDPDFIPANYVEAARTESTFDEEGGETLDPPDDKASSSRTPGTSSTRLPPPEKKPASAGGMKMWMILAGVFVALLFLGGMIALGVVVGLFFVAG
ncbi:MAG: protein phosphatase 2C domain-containing protein [Alphaproteobacteria bacterium]|nr:protein phosphatase 2C domain-containing protein [Alphaproteobacteria bacterium]